MDLIHNNISRYVQEECANRLYSVCVYIYIYITVRYSLFSIIRIAALYIYIERERERERAAIRMMENSEYLTVY